MSETVLILAGGMTPTIEVQRALPPAAMCIAADSGIDHARHLGLVPDVAVGDFDSVSADGLAWVRQTGAQVFEHSADKDQTDLELAMEHAVAADPDRIVVAALGGGRLDHFLANFAVLADRRYCDSTVDCMVGTALVSVVHRHRRLVGESGEHISLLPVNGDADGIVTTGLAYELRHEGLRAGSSRGVSNYFEATSASVSLTEGTLLAIQPDHLSLVRPTEQPEGGG